MKNNRLDMAAFIAAYQRAYEQGRTVGDLAKELGVTGNCLHQRRFVLERKKGIVLPTLKRTVVRRKSRVRPAGKAWSDVEIRNPGAAMPVRMHAPETFVMFVGGAA